MAKPRVIVTRRLPEPVERRLTEQFDAVLNRDDVQHRSSAVSIVSVRLHGRCAIRRVRQKSLSFARWLHCAVASSIDWASLLRRGNVFNTLPW